MLSQEAVTPVKTGVQESFNQLKALESFFLGHGNVDPLRRR
jgi:hypothetical protein